MMIQIPKLYTDLNVEGCFKWQDEAIFIQDALELTGAKNILETGFFRGSSAFMFLHLGKDTRITSVDPMLGQDGLLENTTKLKEVFGDRFTFIREDSKLVRPMLAGQKFDLMFIDGDHWEEGIRNDIQLAIDLNIPWILMDDFVTSVEQVYFREFVSKFLPIVRLYDRPGMFQGKPIPIALCKQRNLSQIANPVTALYV